LFPEQRVYVQLQTFSLTVKLWLSYCSCDQQATVMPSEENLSLNEIQPTELRFSLNFFAFDNFPKFFGRISKVLGRTIPNYID
jgi:hypothetical protein